MKRFRYALEPILLMRQWDVQAALSALGEHNARQRQHQQHVDHLQSLEEQAVAERTTLLTPGATLSIAQIARGTRYHTDLRTQIVAASARTKQLDREREELVARLTRFQLEVEGYEEHRRDMHERFERDQTSTDMKQADDQWNMLSARSEGDEYPT